MLFWWVWEQKVRRFLERTVWFLFVSLWHLYIIFLEISTRSEHLEAKWPRGENESQAEKSELLSLCLVPEGLVKSPSGGWWMRGKACWLLKAHLKAFSFHTRSCWPFLGRRGLPYYQLSKGSSRSRKFQSWLWVNRDESWMLTSQILMPLSYFKSTKDGP